MVWRRWNAVLKLTSSVLAFRCSVGPNNSSSAVYSHETHVMVLLKQYSAAAARMASCREPRQGVVA